MIDTKKEVRRYCLGFIFLVGDSPDSTKVLLTLKDHPEWQKGKYNGIGGHVEKGESPYQAMKREGEEEVGLSLEWINVGLMRNFQGDKPWEMGVFYTCIAENFHKTENDVGEKLEMINVREAISLALDGKAIPNLAYLIPICIEGNVTFDIAHWI